jgi:regulator of sigma E protease
MLAHEFGHFVAARRVGIEVREFSLGFGPKLLSFGGPESMFNRRVQQNVKGREELIPTEYALRLIPFGASVRMTGEEIGDAPSPYSYASKTPGQKAMVAFSGPFMNVVLAVIIFILAYTMIGVPQPLNQALVGGIVAGKPADRAGIKPGDRIVAINGQRVETWDEMVAIVSKSEPGKAISLQTERAGSYRTIQVKPEKNEQTNSSIIGITAKYRLQKQGLVQGVKLGFLNTYYTTGEILKGVFSLATGNVSTKDLAGPVGITKMIGEAAESGILTLLGFTALLSINLGIFNLLPIPALDGSRMVFALVEAVRRRPIEPERENLVHLIGFALLMLLLTFVTYNDIVRLVKG